MGGFFNQSGGGGSTPGAVVNYASSLTPVLISTAVLTPFYSYTFTANEFVAGMTLRITSQGIVPNTSPGTTNGFEYRCVIGGGGFAVTQIPAPAEPWSGEQSQIKIVTEITIVTATRISGSVVMHFSDDDSGFSAFTVGSISALSGVNFAIGNTIVLGLLQAGGGNTQLTMLSSIFELIPATP